MPRGVTGSRGICLIRGCGRRYLAKGFCQKHYQAIRENKTKRAIYNATPEQKIRLKARSASPERKTYEAAYHADPENKAKKAAYGTVYRSAHKEEISAYNDTYDHSAYQAARMATDPLYKFERTVRSMIRQSFRNSYFSKTSNTAKILGCLFELAMTSTGWFRGCHIHHIIPLHTANTKEDIERLNHHTNLIALTKEEHKALHAGRFELIPRKNQLN